MRRVLLFFFLLESVQSSCPSGFELVRDGECRGLYTTMDLSYDVAVATAVEKCKEIDGQPLIIHDEEHETYWASRISEEFPLNLLALECNITSKEWQWTDGSRLDYKASTITSGYDLDTPCKSGQNYFIYNKDSWQVWAAGNFDVYILCTTQLLPPIRSDDGCDSFEDDSEDDVCYQIGAIAESWQDAQMICRKLGANLASIHNIQENSFIRRLAVSKGAVDGVFLGASISGKEDKFGWIDGSTWDYDNFYPGFPKPGFGDCLAMDTSSPSGLWMNFNCTSKLPVACIRDQEPVPEPSCSSELWKEETIITSPGFPYSASTPCEYFLNVEEGKLVELEIILLEANSCCDSLTISDGYLGGSVIANLTGEVRNATFTTSATNFMRVSWEPNGGVNVKGVAMTYRAV